MEMLSVRDVESWLRSADAHDEAWDLERDADYRFACARLR
jgi:hypothetical protein